MHACMRACVCGCVRVCVCVCVCVRLCAHMRACVHACVWESMIINYCHIHILSSFYFKILVICKPVFFGQLQTNFLSYNDNDNNKLKLEVAH